MRGITSQVWSCAAIVCLLSTPVLAAESVDISTLPEGFEGTLPAYLENDPASDAPWAISSEQSQAGAQSLRSGDIGNNQISAITLNGPLPAGTLSFDYLELTESCCDVMEVQVDGKRFNFRTLAQSDDWQHIEIIIPDQTQTVTFLYRKDEAASAREDAVWIDNLDFSTTVDTGGEPLDTDGDGLADDQENGYAALDPYNADDASEDYDGDRVSNYSEVISGYNPDVQNVFPLHDAFDFYPLGDITWSYTLPDSPGKTIESTPQEENGRFKLANGDTYDLIERNTDGLFLIEHGYTDSDGTKVRMVFDTPKLILPDAVRMGIVYEWSGTIEVLTKATDADEDARYEKAETFEEHLELEATMETSVDFQGETYDGVVISVLTTRTNEADEIFQDRQMRLYAKDLGLFFDGSDGAELESLNIRELDTESRADVEPEETLPESSSGGSGSMPSLLLGALALLALTRRRVQRA